MHCYTSLINSDCMLPHVMHAMEMRSEQKVVQHAWYGQMQVAMHPQGFLPSTPR